MHHLFFQRKNSGISLVETVVGVAIFALVSLMLYTTFSRVFATVRAAQARVNAITLANEQFELIRNLPYANIGTLTGIPHGVIPANQVFNRGGMIFVSTTTVRNIDLPFDGVASGTPNDLSPADNKLVEVEVTCTTCRNFRPLTLSTNVGPKGLESASTNGALFVKVLDSVGSPVSGANVRIVNSSTTPAIDISDVTATSGMLQIIDAPPGTEVYRVYVTKAGYSPDRSYERTATMTNPVTPDSTVTIQTVTQPVFFIDRTSTLNFSAVSPSCSPIPNVQIHMSGAKIISATPDVLKYDSWMYTDPTGMLVLNDVEWDNYTIMATSTTHELAGVMPLQPVSVTPGSTQNIQLVMVPINTRSVLVTVKDVATGLPITGADVTLEKGGASTTLTTGRGFLGQSDWSGGSGQSEYTLADHYQSDDGGVDVSTVSGAVRLQDVLGLYTPSGTLYSSTFDTGSVSNFYQFLYQPTSQPIDTGDSVQFQIATGNATSSWSYRGPDGTGATFYNSTTTDISTVHNGDRYLRYKMLLSTASTTFTPSVSDIQFTFTSACVPPGQVIFQGLTNGTYNITVSKSGYVTELDSVVVDATTPWQEKQEVLSP